MKNRGRICLHVPFLYPVTTNQAPEFAGGAEVQQWLLARGLAAHGFDVSVVTCDYGQPERVVTEGVTLIRSYRPFEGLPVVRFFHPRLTGAVTALASADADVYFIQSAGLQAGVTYEVARARHAAFVFLAAHDNDALPDLPFLTNPRDRWWYRRALRRANRVLAQTETQRRLFLEHFEIDAEVVTNPVELPASLVDPGGDGVALWLATYKPAKRPEWFTALARRIPERRFVMAGVIPPRPLTQDAWLAALATARECPNLDVRGYVRHDQLGALFGTVSLFVHTSPAEGFPNTFLEAWAHGLPTLTCFDPDGVIGGEGLGAVVDSVEALEAEARRWLDDPQARRAAGRRARAYVEAHHAPDLIYRRLGELLDPLVAEVRARRIRRRARERRHRAR